METLPDGTMRLITVEDGPERGKNVGCVDGGNDDDDDGDDDDQYSDLESDDSDSADHSNNDGAESFVAAGTRAGRKLEQDSGLTDVVPGEEPRQDVEAGDGGRGVGNGCSEDARPHGSARLPLHVLRTLNLAGNR
jgi:hypothetical protein